jgi:hypothetical protein
MKIIVTSNTIFKQSTLPSSELASNEKIDVVAGSKFEVSTYLEMGNHFKFTLKNESLAGRNTWIAYKSHIELIGDDGLKIVGEYKVGDKLPERINLPIPWFSQLDNYFQPKKTCNVTSVAMCLYYFGIVLKIAINNLKMNYLTLLKVRDGISIPMKIYGNYSGNMGYLISSKRTQLGMKSRYIWRIKNP